MRVQPSQWLRAVRVASRQRVERLVAKSATILRDRAIRQAKVKIILAGKQPQDFSERDLETIVAEEERLIVARVRASSLTAVLALLGFSIL